MRLTAHPAGGIIRCKSQLRWAPGPLENALWPLDVDPANNAFFEALFLTRVGSVSIPHNALPSVSGSL